MKKKYVDRASMWPYEGQQQSQFKDMAEKYKVLPDLELSAKKLEALVNPQSF